MTLAIKIEDSGSGLLPGQTGWHNAQSTGSPVDCKPLFRVQSQSSGLTVQSESSGVQWSPISPVESSQSSGVQWNPVSPVHYYLLLININYEYYKKSEN